MNRVLIARPAGRFPSDAAHGESRPLHLAVPAGAAHRLCLPQQASGARPEEGHDITSPGPFSLGRVAAAAAPWHSPTTPWERGGTAQDPFAPDTGVCAPDSGCVPAGCSARSCDVFVADCAHACCCCCPVCVDTYTSPLTGEVIAVSAVLRTTTSATRGCRRRGRLQRPRRRRRSGRARRCRRHRGPTRYAPATRLREPRTRLQRGAHRVMLIAGAQLNPLQRRLWRDGESQSRVEARLGGRSARGRAPFEQLRRRTDAIASPRIGPGIAPWSRGRHSSY